MVERHLIWPLFCLLSTASCERRRPSFVTLMQRVSFVDAWRKRAKSSFPAAGSNPLPLRMEMGLPMAS